MSSHAEPHRPMSSREPRQWGAVGATFWSVVAFFVPQFALLPLLGFLDALPIDRNAKIFILQGVAQLVTLAVLWLVVRGLYRSGPRAFDLGKFDPGLLGWSVLAFPLYLITSTVMSNLLAVFFGVNLLEQQNIGYSEPNGFELALIFVALVLLAPFVEEVLFRGFLFSAFRRTFGFWIGAIGVSLLFAVAHGQANVGIDVFVLSMFLCYLREKTDSLWPAIALHSLKNLVAFVVLFIMKIS